MAPSFYHYTVSRQAPRKGPVIRMTCPSDGVFGELTEEGGDS